MVFINYVVLVDGIIYHYIWYNTTGWFLSKKRFNVSDLYGRLWYVPKLPIYNIHVEKRVQFSKSECLSLFFM